MSVAAASGGRLCSDESGGTGDGLTEMSAARVDAHVVVAGTPPQHALHALVDVCTHVTDQCTSVNYSLGNRPHNRQLPADRAFLE